MSRVIDLSMQRRNGGRGKPLKHPAGVTLPFEGPSDAALIIPEIRTEIRSGSYDADMIGLLDAAVRPGDRVLVIGAGLGVLSTLIARREGVARVIAVEANTGLIPYLQRTHAMNGVEQVETVNAVLAEGKKGRAPFFARRDIRASSLLPHDRSWQQVIMVPFMDLNLILAEERISLIVSEIPTASAALLARAAPGGVERILLSAADDPARAWADDGICAQLVARGFVAQASGSAVLFRRPDTPKKRRTRAADAGKTEAQSNEAKAGDTEQGEAEGIAAAQAGAARTREPWRRRRNRPHGGGPEPAGPQPNITRLAANATSQAVLMNPDSSKRLQPAERPRSPSRKVIPLRPKSL